MTQVVEVVMLPQDQRLPYYCHQCSIHLYREGKWRTLATNASAKGRLVNGGNKKRKENKGRRKNPPRICSRGTEEYTPLGSVLLSGSLCGTSSQK